MGFIDRFWSGRRRTPAQTAIARIEADLLPDLPLRRLEATDVAAAGLAMTRQQLEAISLPFGMGLDSDENLYRRLTGNGKQTRRDLNPIQQDRMLEIAWYLWEQNTFARRLITLMTDLILGEGINVEATDERVQDTIDAMWHHRVNQLKTRIREFYNALSINGELIMPAMPNPYTGIPVLGFIDPYQVRDVITLPDNVLVPDIVELKPNSGEDVGQRLKIIRENPETGLLEGEVFCFAINKLPNSTRGRSDLLPVADWLDLYDQYMFGEVERLSLLSAFVWDYTITGADDKKIKDKLAKFPLPKPGTVFAHNDKESLTAQTPDLKATDRSEVARILRVHIAGSMGYPLSYLGDIESNKATIEGQNDVMMKTPAARQKEFAGFIDLIIRFAIEQAQSKNGALFRGATNGYKIVMPEISARDVSRVGAVLGTVASAMDTGIANGTMSKQASTAVMVAVLKHLGVELEPQTVLNQVDEEAQEAQGRAELQHAATAAKHATLNPNPPIPDVTFVPDLSQGGGDTVSQGAV